MRHDSGTSLRGRMMIPLVLGFWFLSSWIDGGALAQSSIPPGFDLFETEPTETRFRFQSDSIRIPAGFFDPECAPFSGTLFFKGLPIGVFRGQAIGTADTVIERKDTANVRPSSSDTIPIELVALSLTSTRPITVRCGTDTQVWSVEAMPSSSRASTGTMTINKRDDNGGTFNSELTVFPLFKFTRHSDLAERFLDVGTLDLRPSEVGELTLKARSVPWVHSCPPIARVVSGFNDLFCPSARSNGQVPSRVEGAAIRQGVLPAKR